MDEENIVKEADKQYEEDEPMQFGKLGATLIEIHPQSNTKVLNDGSTTKRAGKMSKSGGFTARLVELNITQVIPTGSEDGEQRDGDDDNLLASPSPDELCSPSSFQPNTSPLPPLKRSPDKSIMKQSRFGPPLVVEFIKELQPFEKFWEETETKYEVAKKWESEMKTLRLVTATPEASRKVKFSSMWENDEK